MNSDTLPTLVPEAVPVGRFQALQAGHYWRARAALPDHEIDDGEVLLVQSIRWVDEVPHTIILRVHPSKYVAGRATEHRFLRDDFLSWFQFEPQATTVRAAEIQDLHTRVQTLQSALAAPDMAGGVFPALTGPAASADAGGSVAQAIASGFTITTVDALKARVRQQQDVVAARAARLQGMTQEIANTLTALGPYYAEQAAAALAQTEDVRAYAEELMAGIASLDLYVGTDVTVTRLRTGDSASADVPLTFVQQKLYMDEEWAAYADLDAQCDFRAFPAFAEALATEDGLVNQIFPTPRCTLAMATTRRTVDYGDPWTNSERKGHNGLVFLLVRDGGNIFQVISPVESHLGAERLFPSLDEHDALFRGYDGRMIAFADVAYTDKLEGHARSALHYKRFLLLICGLDHREHLFGTFYPATPGASLLDLAFQERYCRFLHDDDGAGLLPNGRQRPSLNDWIKDCNAHLRSGSRVLCYWRTLINPDTAPALCSRSNKYGRFHHKALPDDAFSVVEVARSGTALEVAVPIAHNGRTRMHRVTLSAYRSGYYYSDEDLPYLCLDTVTPADLAYYIGRRADRRHFLFYIRVFKTALASLEAERVLEAQTRAALADALADGRIVAAVEVPDLIESAVRAWRAAHRGAALPLPTGDAHAWKTLLDYLGHAAHAADVTARVTAWTKAEGLAPLRLVLTGHARWVLYAAPRDEERDDRLTPHIWVHRIILRLGRRQLGEQDRRWEVLPMADAAETTIHEWPEAAAWKNLTGPWLRYADKQWLCARVEAGLARLDAWAGDPATSLDWPTAQADWLTVRRAASRKLVCNPALFLPFGLACSEHQKLIVLGVGQDDGHAALAARAPTEAAREVFRQAFCGFYENHAHAAQTWDADTATESWGLYQIAVTKWQQADGDFPPDVYSLNQGPEYGAPIDPLLGPRWARQRAWMEEQGRSIWVDPRWMDATGALIADAKLSIRRPADYAPYEIQEIDIQQDGDKPLPAITRWWVGRPLPDTETPSAQEPQRWRARDYLPGPVTHYSGTGWFDVSPAAAVARLTARVATLGGGHPVEATEDSALPPLAPGMRRWYLASHDRPESSD